MQEALLTASRAWPVDGVPENPRSWLIRIGRYRPPGGPGPGRRGAPRDGTRPGAGARCVAARPLRAPCRRRGVAGRSTAACRTREAG
ncbi:hypothetical protein [Micromonospora sp. KLBMP9576]|uniref:hypothetical protein n=1 Tax=Micromonospora sp. KLBMP9576 TaxID=3424769 RepID=UPI003D910C47